MNTKTGFCLHDDGAATTLVEVRPMRGTWRVENLKRTGSATGPDAELMGRLKRGRQPLVVMTPGEVVQHAVVGLPVLRGKALGRALGGSVARDQGGNPDDWRLAWRSIGQPEKTRAGLQQNQFLLYARRDDIAARTEPLLARGVSPTHLLPDYLVLDQFFRAHGPEHADLKAWNIVFVGRRHQFLVIGTNEVPLLVRALPEDLSGGANRDEYVGRLATEIERSLHFARQIEPAPDIGRLVIAGDPETTAALVARLAATGSLDVAHWPIADQFTWGPHTADADEVLPLMAAVLGLGKVEYDLLTRPGSWRPSAETMRRLRTASATAATVALPLLTAGGLVTARVQQTYLEDARARVDEALADAQAAETVYEAQKVLLAREDRIAEVAGDKPDLEAVLVKLADLTPPSVVFNTLEIRERSHSHFLLRIEGHSAATSSAAAQAAVLQFLANLDGADFLYRRTEPQLMRLMPGEGDLRTEKTSRFQMDLILKREGPRPQEETT